jgi:hypothetical protein
MRKWKVEGGRRKGEGGRNMTHHPPSDVGIDLAMKNVNG